MPKFSSEVKLYAACTVGLLIFEVSAVRRMKKTKELLEELGAARSSLPAEELPATPEDLIDFCRLLVHTPTIYYCNN